MLEKCYEFAGLNFLSEVGEAATSESSFEDLVLHIRSIPPSLSLPNVLPVSSGHVTSHRRQICIKSDQY
jgi:hypothetical protein